MTETVRLQWLDGYGDSIEVAGSWNGWKPEPMKGSGAGKYFDIPGLEMGSVVIFKFLVDGGWATSVNYKVSRDGYENHQIMVSEDVVLKQEPPETLQQTNTEKIDDRDKDTDAKEENDRDEDTDVKEENSEMNGIVEDPGISREQPEPVLSSKPENETEEGGQCSVM
uniref:AMP-activated protein kinase glycogen-binding domain-containing protein n=1 Tax=Compsopogon caeruleus TaxID=31354 RepID=A0A7S1TG21_9RHOD|mmetsp:Transcript_5546/g.11186  ORF Transcript_5546/g.11186 Transcript_5546/m.11186 type:complete len:167 (+) Transcript_5546:84-584(+)|eukprot:CAMPEP_0184687632 /NCGR_PEP_ID=MMETSP0312-20130426/27194_1 /TAXON_ID=31354 /ORGANISM="Compsopogon coeruleus, Strain SAG 36.94" /LENGTH=166 /DNA_ID=CAMNT_0027144003 /DNA_START=75 /DNA_END=575 /DNA_ORIENTATION=-